jgi:NAD(P)-dependent dehydrogenase (short-subunit alcohol dehydrogenase family)
MVCDVTSPASVQAAFARIRERHGRIDVLVNNAGLAGGDSIDAPDEAFFEAIVQSNLTGTWRCSAAAIPMMSRGARIICISSVLGLKAVPDQIAYTAAKHGVIGLMKSLALALAPRGITVNAVCPGWVETDMARSRFAELGITRELAAQGVPTGAVLQPAEVAALILYLASPACAQLTGQAIALDGGVSAG